MNFDHVEKYPLSALPTPPQNVPVVLGIDWYDNFDAPYMKMVGKRKTYWIGAGRLGGVRGGHCICLLPAHISDALGWWSFYDQGREGACVGFGSSRCMSLLNRDRYNARWLWDQAKVVDEWPDTNPGDDNGTSVHAAFDILRIKGHVLAHDASQTPLLSAGIAANRWATTAQQVLDALGTPTWDHVRILNSWGHDGYPHITNMPASILDMLLRADGEAAIPTDR